MSAVLEHKAAAQGAGGITLTQGQQDALGAFSSFLMDPAEQVFVIEGYSGTGKSTLVETIMDRLPTLQKMAKLMDPNYTEYTLELTATTNKAAENFGRITGMSVSTIHSFLGLRVETDWQTRATTLKPSNKAVPEYCLIFIDEASYIDSPLLTWIFKLVKNCKIVFMGDPAQLTPVKYDTAPVFQAGFSTAKLTQVMRQAKGNPIMDLSTKFRETVTSGEFFSFTPDGNHIQYLDRDSFNQKILEEFTRPDWKFLDSKFLAWTNKTVIDYNHAVRDAVTGDPQFQVGDYAVCNKFISNDRKTIKTDQMVCITGIQEGQESFGIPGRTYTIDYGMKVFGPSSLAQWKSVVRELTKQEQSSSLDWIEHNWIDLRAAYAQTINKSQGSTYDRVFIDLDDIKRCNNGNQIARMLYVAVSRARHQVFLTGDLV